MRSPTDGMRRVLRDAYKGNCIARSNRTHLKGLVSRGFLNEELNITGEGKLYILSSLPLASQCQDLDIPLKVLEWDQTEKPEIWTSYHYSKIGFANAYCEGGAIGLVLKGLCLDALTRTSYFFGTCVSAREDACLKGIVTLAGKNEKVIESITEDIYETDRAKYLAACEEILSYPAINEWYPGLNMNFLEQMYDAFSKEEYCRIARWLAKNPEHRNGWPDLTLISEGVVRFIEVKTTDKLHYSQLVTMPSIKNLISADILVVKLKKQRCQKGGCSNAAAHHNIP